MTQQEQIAALAAELKRLGKMHWSTWEADIWTDGTVFDHRGYDYVEHPSVALSALHGIAAEMRANARLTIIRDGEVWEVWHFDQSGSCRDGQYKSFPEAVIAALKNIEAE